MHIDLPLRNQRIIVAPLCWGLGHATRCIPIVKQLLDQSNEVALASDGEAYDLLKKEFPSLKLYELPPYNITYKYPSMAFNMLVQAGKIYSSIKAERKVADQLAKDWKADTIISDNRLGFRTSHTHNIYITHQLNVLGSNKIESYVASKVHRYWYEKYDECWVPDSKGEKALAGKLSTQKSDMATTYIGPVTRLAPPVTNHLKSIDVVAILSGPEPQRSKLESLLREVFSRYPDKKLAIVRGTHSTTQGHRGNASHIKTYDLLDSKALNLLVHQSENIICRAGYSSIMDLVGIGRTATLIPTPGQTEQEYLADYLNGRHQFQSIAQSDILAKLKI